MLEKLHIPAKHAMVLWEPRREPTGDLNDRRIVVVDHRDNNRQNDLLILPSSMGACWQGWEEADPLKRATHLLGLFAMIVGCDGVPGDEAHREFMKIVEYREWVEKRTGPFAEAYGSWEADRISDAA